MSLASRLTDFIAAVGADIKALSVMSVPFSSSGTLVVKTGAAGWTNRTGRTLTITEVYLEVGTAPTGSALTCDVNKNGTTIFTTQANRPKITASSTSGSSTTIDVTSISNGDRITFDVDVVGSTNPGSDLTVQVVMK